MLKNGQLEASCQSGIEAMPDVVIAMKFQHLLEDSDLREGKGRDVNRSFLLNMAKYQLSRMTNPFAIKILTEQIRKTERRE